MADFIDLQGASGASYRFRLAPPEAPHTSVAGLVAIVRGDGPEREVLLLAPSYDLAVDVVRAAELAHEHRAQVWTRLNIPTPLRVAEAEDLAARYPSTLAWRAGA